jgi:CBS domain containing-hemolysin-like protein
VLIKALLVLVLVAANGFFVAAEFALVKVRLGEIRVLARAGSTTARIVEQLLGRIDAYLSACQLGITLASLGLGWVGEPLVAASLAPLFEQLGLPVRHVHFVAVPLAFAIITFLHITAGQQAPKILAIKRSLPTARVIGVPIFLFYKIFRPFIWLLNSSSNLMLASIGIEVNGGHGEIPTEQELRHLVLESATGGNLTHRERRIIENVLDLEEKTARRYMVPRHQVLFLDRGDTMEVKLQQAVDSGRTRLPLCNGDLDNVVGIVHVKDVFQTLAKGGTVSSLAAMARPALFLPELITLDNLLMEFQRERVPLALLVDEYGVLSGMITLEDVLVEMLGPMRDEFETSGPGIIPKGAGRFDVDALCPIDKVTKNCRLVLPEESEADTIGGTVVDLLGRIPLAGEKVSLPPHVITILSAEPTHVLRVLIEPEPHEANSEDAGDGRPD